MISALLFFMPLVVQAEMEREDLLSKETLTLTSGLTIEAQYLPEQDSFLLSLEAFGALVADLELAGPSCIKRLDAVKQECQAALSDALKRAEERQVELYEAWTKDQSTILTLNNDLRETDQERIMWRWFAFGLGAAALVSTSVLILTVD